jgi:EVE domain
VVCVQPGVVGIVEVVKEGYPDYTSWDASSDGYDPKSTEDAPRWFMVDVKPVCPACFVPDAFLPLPPYFLFFLHISCSLELNCATVTGTEAAATGLFDRA